MFSWGINKKSGKKSGFLAFISLIKNQFTAGVSVVVAQGTPSTARHGWVVLRQIPICVLVVFMLWILAQVYWYVKNICKKQCVVCYARV